jgi:RNA polymerase subunit RPABC4/transcription elongation factor Spt4
MAEAAQRLKANLRFAGQACAQCGKPFVIGEDLASCNACGDKHHASCWDSAGGCSRTGCVNAPLEQLAMPAKETVAPSPFVSGDRTSCPHCQRLIVPSDVVCPYCNQIATPDGVYHGPKENAPGAQASLVYGIVGLLVCGLILGIVAISKSNQAKAAIRSNPRYGGEGLATAGFVMGIIDIVAWAIIVVLQVSART